MSEKTIWLQALDDDTSATARVVYSENLDHDVKKLFKKIFNREMGCVKWFCGVPGKDRVVVWQATPWNGSRQYWLHISFSDGRFW